MKKIALLLISLFFSLTLCAQEHLKFRGVPIDGPMDAYVEQLIQKGFTPLDVDLQSNMRMMEGLFTGEKVELIILGTGSENTVCSTIVKFENTQSWESLTASYYMLKRAYTKKYGNPVSETEEMESPWDKHLSIMGLYHGKGKYETYYTTDEGIILLRLIGYDDDNACVTIHYTDRINTQIKREQNIQDEI